MIKCFSCGKVGEGRTTNIGNGFSVDVCEGCIRRYGDSWSAICDAFARHLLSPIKKARH